MASKRALRRKSCTGKVRHTSAQAAQAARRALFLPQGYTGLINVYRCHFCGGYHIGHAGR
jgi:hypothetical protein